MLTRLFKAFGPIAPLFAGALLSGCDNMTMRINDEEGVPLAEKISTHHASPEQQTAREEISQALQDLHDAVGGAS